MAPMPHEPGMTALEGLMTQLFGGCGWHSKRLSGWPPLTDEPGAPGPGGPGRRCRDRQDVAGPCPNHTHTDESTLPPQVFAAAIDETLRASIAVAVTFIPRPLRAQS